MYIYLVQTHEYGCVIDLQVGQTSDIGNDTSFLDQYHVIKYLGRGDFSNVRLIERKSGDSSAGKKELFATKIVPKAGISK